MKKRITMLCIIILATILMTALGYWIVTTIPYQSQPLENAAEHYLQAVNALNNAQDLKLQIRISTKTQIGSQTYTLLSDQTISYTDLHTEAMTASVEEVLTVGSHKANVSEVYSNNTVYITMLGGSFAGNCTPDEFLARQVPVIALTPSSYKNIDGIIRHNTSIIRFTQATSAEPWALPDGGELITAEGIAWLDQSDRLLKSRYTLTYRCAGVTFTKEYSITLKTASEITVELPDNPESYTMLASPYAPRMLEIAAGYLTQEGSITADYDELIQCEAFGDKRHREILINMQADDGWSARLDTSITLTNSSREDDVVHLTQSETFLNGQHTVSSNGATPELDATVTEDLFHNYCHELLIGTIVQQHYISGATQNEESDIYHIEFSANEDFARYVSSYACQALYQDAGILDAIADNYTTKEIRCYLNISATTGLPKAAGIYFCGSYTIHNIQYQLIYQADQTYTIPGHGAQAAISAPLN